MTARKLAILGSTGSVGTQALEVAERHPERLEVVALAAGSNDELLAEQVRRWKPTIVSVADEDTAARLRPRLGATDVRLVSGREGLLEATSGAGADIVLNAVVGAAGLAATFEAVDNGVDVALANKESLVMAGGLIMGAARRTGAAVLPVDSEPNALHQCLRRATDGDVRRLILTASGGPFRGWSAEQLAAVTPERALQHPTWKMGRRITIDSATLMNKGFEIIETHWLFAMPAEKIDVVIHPQSIVHSLVELVDGSMIAHAGPTDMRLPIQDALSYPHRWEPSVEPLDLVASAPWTFEPAERDHYPALQIAYDALATGGTAPAMVNAADEVAVAAFLDGSLPFDRIIPLVVRTLENLESAPLSGIDSALKADATARRETTRILEESA